MTTDCEFIALSEDFVFKHIFGNEEYVTDLLDSYFEYLNVDERVDIIRVSKQSYMQKDNIHKKNVYLDIIAYLNDGKIINIEMYNKFSKVERKKSLSYASQIYFNQIMKKETYGKIQKVISLNIIANGINKDYAELVSVNRLTDLVNSLNYVDDDIEMVLVCLDNLSKIPYARGEARFLTWCRLISAKTRREFHKYVKGDSLFMRVEEDLEKYISMPEIGDFYHNNNWKIESAELRGEEKRALETAKIMLQEKCNINLISKATGLFIDTINALKD